MFVSNSVHISPLNSDLAEPPCSPGSTMSPEEVTQDSRGIDEKGIGSIFSGVPMANPRKDMCYKHLQTIYLRDILSYMYVQIYGFLQFILIGGLEHFYFSIYWEFHNPN